MTSLYEKIVSVVAKPPAQRTDFEISEIVPWFKNKSPLFKPIKPEIVKNVIRHCEFEHCETDSVIIKQGDAGDKLYIVLHGQVSIYVIQDKDNAEETLQQVDSAMSKRTLDRALLGQRVWTTGEGNAFGEIALIKDCIRTASVVVDENADLMVVDRNLYNASVRDVMEREYKAKSNFVDNHWLFSTWSSRHKKQLIISLRHDTCQYNYPLARQGEPCDKAYFILSGEAEVSVDPATHKNQYQKLWNEARHKWPKLMDREVDDDATIPPHTRLRMRNARHRSQEVCLLGALEYVGFVEFLLRLDNSSYTVRTTCETEVLEITREQFERMFVKRKPESLPLLRDDVSIRLQFFLSRVSGAPLMLYMLLKLEQSIPPTQRSVPVTTSSRADFNNSSNSNGLQEQQAATSIGSQSSKKDKELTREGTQFGQLMASLQDRFVSTGSCEPDSQIKHTLLNELEERMRAWLTMTKKHGGSAGGADQVATMKRFLVTNLREFPRPGNKVLSNQAPSRK